MSTAPTKSSPRRAGRSTRRCLAATVTNSGPCPAVERNAEFKALPDDWRDLVLHLVAAHHGQARPVIETSGLRGRAALRARRTRPRGHAALRAAAEALGAVGSGMVGSAPARGGPAGLARQRGGTSRSAQEIASDERSIRSPSISSIPAKCSPALASLKPPTCCSATPRADSTGATKETSSFALRARGRAESVRDRTGIPGGGGAEAVGTDRLCRSAAQERQGQRRRGR